MKRAGKGLGNGFKAAARLLAFVGLVGLAPHLASASDGVFEINQVCAEQTGCFPGDTAGFPVSISASGSYRLTSDLRLVVSGSNAIFVTANDVSLDLAGFGLRGPVTCVNFVCSPSGSGRGVYAFSSSHFQIFNGSISGFWGDGILGGQGFVARDLKAHNNAGDGVRAVNGALLSGVNSSNNGVRGILLGEDGVVENCQASRSGSTGIAVGVGSIIRSSTASDNAGNGFGAQLSISGAEGVSIIDSISRENGGVGMIMGINARASANQVFSNDGGGIETDDHSIVRGNTIRGGPFGILAGTHAHITGNQVADSTGIGIVGSTSSLISDNASSSHAGDGILAGNASTIRNNTVNSNGNDGIEAGAGSNVIGNTARSNGLLGLRAETSEVRFSDNAFSNNNNGSANPQTASGTSVGGNLCGASTVCP